MSSKAAPLPDWVKGGGPKPTPTHAKADGTPQLFPKGVKTPLNLLYERLQKIPGWEKPDVEPRQHKQGFSCVITLRKENKQDRSNPHTVVFEPREPGARLTCASSLEAKHWGATYALFRLFNHLSLQKMLPAGPREYWIQLEGVKAQSSPDDEWKWAADPFDAVQKRDASAAAREKERAERAARRADPAARPLSRAWQRAPDVKMAPALRELVEATVRTHMAALLPAGGDIDDDNAGGDIVDVDTSALERELHELGLRPGYVRKVVSWLVHAREKYADARAMSELRRTHPLLATVLALSNREAAIEYSVLYLPEQDLPPRLRPTAASESFVTSAALGGDQERLIDRWTTGKFVRGAGFPADTVQQVLERVRARIPDASIAEREAIALDMLLHLLVGEDVEPVRPPATDTTRFAEERESLACTDVVADVPAREAIGSDFSVHIGTHARDSVDLRVAVPPVSAYLQGGWPLIYVSSPTLPAFLRLALTQHAVQCLRGEHGRQDICDALEIGGALFLVADELRDKLVGMLEDPPDLDVVMEHLVEKKEVARVAPAPAAGPAPSAKPRRAAPLRRSAELDAALRTQLDAMHASAAYKEIAAQRESLPAHGARDDLLAALRAHRVVVVAGETGCGKTTQVPQFILDDAIARGCGSGVSIVVTQPRRVSAMGVAARVANERCESLDAQSAEAQVGYAIRGERRAARGCRILFSTTGVLLRRLAAGGDPTLNSVSHVIVDEVHERSTDSDLLLLLLRDVLAANPELRVVLMSATIKAETFTAYFGGAPYFCIPGRTFPVHNIYLEELVAATQFRCAWHARVSNEDALVDVSGAPDDDAVQTLRQLATGRTDYELVARAVAHALGLGDGAVLVFCPGVGEIRQAMQAIAALGRRDLLLLPLHANLPAPEQRRVFERAPPGVRKVVVSTNVAETSITIPEVCFVIDTGRVREAQYDVQLSVHRLVDTWASRAACRQRAGRAGRTRPGTCIRLYSRGMEERLMPAETTPEMQRTPLESVVMQVKAISRADVRAVLGRALSPPSLAAIEATTERLVIAGALHAGGYDARLTPLGRYLADMPIDIRLAKLLVLGALCGCLEPLLHVAALLSSRPIVAAGMQRDEGAAAARRAYVRANSDLLTSAALVAAYLERRHRREKPRALRAWCDELGLSAAALQDVEMTRAQLARNLEDLGLVDGTYISAWRTSGPAWPDARAGPRRARHAADLHSGNTNLLRALLVAALWPGLARVDAPGERYAASATGAVLKEADARELHYFDEHDGRVFVHPGSALFSATQFKSNYVSVFAKSASGASGKTYIRDVSEAPLYGLLLFGGPLHVEHDIGGITVSTGMAPSADAWIKLRASPRIGVLCRQLRTLLDGVLEGGIADPRSLQNAASQGVVAAIAAVLVRDGAD